MGDASVSAVNDGVRSGVAYVGRGFAELLALQCLQTDRCWAGGGGGALWVLTVDQLLV